MTEKMQTLEIQAECELIKAALFGIEPAISVETDWKKVYREMKAQGIMGLPYGWLQKNSISDDTLRNQWILNALKQQVVGSHLLQVQHELFGLLWENGIDAVVIKGSAAGINYPQPQHRGKGDIDFLVREEEMEKVAELLAEYGYEKDLEKPPHGHHIHLMKDQVNLELHWTVASSVVCTDRDYLRHLLHGGLEKAVWAKEDNCSFAMLPERENGIVLLLHIIQHLPNGLGLRQIVDWMMYADRHLRDQQWVKFQPVVARLGFEKMACVVTRMCQIYLGLDERITWCAAADEKLCEELFAFLCKQGNFGRKLGEDDAEARFITGTRSPAALLKRLQEGGMSHWGFARKHHRMARPFAWIYQAVRICGITITRRRLKTLRGSWKEGNYRNVFFQRLGIR